MQNSVIILPYHIDKEKIGCAAIQKIRLGNNILQFKLPPIKAGQKIRLRKAGKYIDSALSGRDVYLLVAESAKRTVDTRRDIQLELPINFKSIGSKSVKHRIVINGKSFDVTVPQTAKPGQLLRMRNLAELCNGGYQGDVLLRLTPTERRFWTIWGLFDGIAEISECKINCKFYIPLLFEIGGEFSFRAPKIIIHG